MNYICKITNTSTNSVCFEVIDDCKCEDGFIYEIIATCLPNNNVDELKELIVSQYNVRGRQLTQEHKDNISKASTGKIGTNLGKTFDDEWRLNISKSIMGKQLKSKRRFSEEVELEICRLYVDENKSAYALGKQFGCQGTLISDLLVRRNIPTRQSNYTGHSNGCNLFTKEQELDICNKYLLSSFSLRELSRQFGCNKNSIKNILLRNNVDPLKVK